VEGGGIGTNIDSVYIRFTDLNEGLHKCRDRKRKGVCVFACVYVCVCVRERERERTRKRHSVSVCVGGCEFECVCGCVYACDCVSISRRQEPKINQYNNDRLKRNLRYVYI